MPQFGFSFECGQKAAHHKTCWISRADRQHGASQRDKVGLLDCNSNHPKAASSKNSSTQEGAFSPPINGTAAARFRGAGVAACAAPSGAASFGDATPCCRSGQGAPDSSFSASDKKQRRKKHFRNKKKRDKYMMTSPGSYKPLQEKEDWDEEIQEVTLKITEKMDALTMPYGPEDVLHFALQDLTLRQSYSAYQSVADNYSPATHHAPPTQWSCCRICPDLEQFADAEEYTKQ